MTKYIPYSEWGFPHQAICEDGKDRAAHIGMRDGNKCRICRQTVATAELHVWHIKAIWRDDNAYAVAHEECAQSIRADRTIAEKIWTENSEDKP